MQDTNKFQISNSNDQTNCFRLDIVIWLLGIVCFLSLVSCFLLLARLFLLHQRQHLQISLFRASFDHPLHDPDESNDDRDKKGC